MEMVVATKWRMPKLNGKYLKESKVVLRENAIVPVEWVEQTNAATKQNGIYYEVNKELTKENNNKRKDQIEDRVNAKEAEKTINSEAVADIVIEAVKQKRTRKSK